MSLGGGGMEGGEENGGKPADFAPNVNVRNSIKNLNISCLEITNIYTQMKISLHPFTLNLSGLEDAA